MELDLKHSREKSAARAAALKTAKEEECALLKRHRELQNQIELARYYLFARETALSLSLSFPTENDFCRRSAFFLLISDFEKDYPSGMMWEFVTTVVANAILLLIYQWIE
tara:strand:+ start:526 stop:855 length:330 start_codon:yes stop_codon:yes gene_type:complete